MEGFNHWIPAFAGMTAGMDAGSPRVGVPCSFALPSQYNLSEQRDASISLSSFQRKLESTPAWMQVVERRREQAAEEDAGEVVNRLRRLSASAVAE